MSQITKRALEQSLKNLLQQKPLSKITISDITEDCGISRMTFYYHFKDIYDLVEWACAEDAARALQNKKTYDTWQQGFVQIFHAVRVFLCLRRYHAGLDPGRYAGRPRGAGEPAGHGHPRRYHAGTGALSHRPPRLYDKSRGLIKIFSAFPP